MERMLGLVWSEVTVTTGQEGNLEGIVLQILLKILFHLKGALQWNRPAFAFQINEKKKKDRVLDLEGLARILVLTSAPSLTSIHHFPT